MSSQIKCWKQVTVEQFNTEILPAGQPAVLKGFFNSWPSVQSALQGESQFYHYMSSLDSGAQLDTLLLAPQTRGRIFYKDGLEGFNYEKRHYPLSAILTQLFKTAGQSDAVHIAAQSALVSECLPGFMAENQNPLLSEAVIPRIWLGNKVIVPAHFDDADNLACVIAGRRTFTLFPPEQVANMYIGPLDYAPTGTPISLVDFTNPDFQRYPRARHALEQARQAELEPGDVLYIPALWWHQVESTDSVNVLCNYWWNGSIGTADSRPSPFSSLLHSLLSFRQLPPDQRKAWQAVFTHFLFQLDDDAFTHIPQDKKGILGQSSFAREAAIKQWLIKELEKAQQRVKP